MTRLSIKEIYERWLSPRGANGIAGDTAIYATAIALAESGGDTHAISPSHDYGLWQINAIHAKQFPVLWPRRFNGYASAKMARAISGDGADWGPWCTAWADPANCGKFLGPYVQHGSPAFGWINAVKSITGDKAGAGGAPRISPGPTPATEEWARIQHLLGHTADDWYGRLATALDTLRRFR